MNRLVSIAALLLTFSVSVHAQSSVPAPEEFLGYPVGERFTPHHRILDYFDELTRRSELVRVETIGETYEHRPLTLVTITSAKNRAMLDQIRRDSAALARGESLAEGRLQNLPATVWLAFGIHGNESSSAEVSMLVASALLGDPQNARLLDDLVVIIDPLQNPDGRERYVNWYRMTRGMKPNADRQASEHQEPWPGGRFNHYLIDMNRDWAWLSQKETQARVAAWPTWNPQVQVDFHEMSAQSTYFFPPDAAPMNANLPRELEGWLETFGRANADDFSKRGWPFFVGEYFDLFYPGYGDSWPSLRGAIGMTYEVAGGGRAGSAINRDDDSVLTLRDRVDRHYVAAMATLRTAAKNREALLRYTHASARAQIDAPGHTYLILPDSPNFEPLVSLLQKQGIAVGMMTGPTSLRATRIDRNATAARSFPAGTAVVSTRQPLGALVNTLLERQPALEQAFIDEQRNRALLDEQDEFYDLTAWSLPVAMNVEAWVATGAVEGITPFVADSPVPFASASYGYIVDGLDPNVYRLAGRLLAAGIRFSVASAEVSFDGRTHARGSLVILKGNNGADLDTRLASAVKSAGVRVQSLASGWSGSGTSVGSSRIRFVKNPEIGLVGGAGSDPTSFGMLWHTLDVDTPVPHSTLTAESFRNLDLKEYGVLVFPHGSYADRLGKRGIEKLKQWVLDGGTLVAVNGASGFLREKDVEISKIVLRGADAPGEAKSAEPAAATPVEARYNDYRIPGAAFTTKMNSRSYLTFGVPRPPAVLVEGSVAFAPVAHAVDNILTVETTAPLLSGVAWEESLSRIAGAAYVVSEKSGRGQVITFSDEPHFRLFWRGTLPIFLNAVLYGPSFPR